MLGVRWDLQDRFHLVEVEVYECHAQVHSDGRGVVLHLGKGEEEGSLLFCQGTHRVDCLARVTLEQVRPQSLSHVYSLVSNWRC